MLIHLIDGFEIEESDTPFPVAFADLTVENPVEQPVGEAVTVAPGTVNVDLAEDRLSRKTSDKTDSNQNGKDSSGSSMEPPSAKVAKQSLTADSSAGSSLQPPEVKCEADAPTKETLEAVMKSPSKAATPRRSVSEEEEMEDEEDDSISIGSKELMTQEEMMNADYASSPPSAAHSPVPSFPLRDVSSTDSFPSTSYRDSQLDDVLEVDVDEKPAIFLCDPDVDKNIVEWTEQDVYHFITGIEGCSQYAEEFISQEIDGQALLLLNEDHLMSNLNVKLGPALKILAKIQENKK